MTASTHPPLRLGLVGAGRFGSFLAEAVSGLPHVALRAVADTRPGAAERLAARHHSRAVQDWSDLLEDSEVDAVVVSTPPADHAVVSLQALESGRHVLCEKPLALDESGAGRLEDAVRRTGRTLVVDHVLRYNPILAALGRLQRELLGQPHRFLFENDASDEDLGDGHWFWDPARSGGIFVEHGVHFFDAAAMLLRRRPTSVQAVAARRADGKVDMVSATVQHGDDVLAGHTHSFTHATRCERQLMRLDYGPAEARVEGWIPVRAVVDLWTDAAGARCVDVLPGRSRELMDVPAFRLSPRARVDVDVERDAGSPPAARGRGRALHLPHRARITLTLGGPAAKAEVYAESVRAAVHDLAACGATGADPRCGVREGAEAVRVAVAATRSAAHGRRVDLSTEPAAHEPRHTPSAPDVPTPTLGGQSS
jgi:predicted dehydrogenase